MRREKNKICVICTDSNRSTLAESFSNANALPLFNTLNNTYDLQLCFGVKHIQLFDTELNTSIHVDFLEGSLAHRQQFGGGRGQAIAKAIGLKHGKTPTVLDATAGLARDAYILATLGCKLTLVEQSPILYTLLEDGIKRALASDTEHSVSNFTNLVCADSRLHIKHVGLNMPPDVICIDPMYPERKKSALVKKDMQILHKLIGSSEGEEKLLETALQFAKYRVIIKRPIHAQPVTGIKPTMAISSKKTRYDVYIVD